MEIWDAYNKDGVMLEQKLVRGQKVPEGVYHIVCEVLVRHKDGGFLLMKRALCKGDNGGKYEATSGGSALAGETPDVCIKRELFEETGIQGENFEHVRFRAYDNGSALLHSYVCVTDWPKDKITLQAGETEGWKWVTEEEFVSLLDHPTTIKEQMDRWHDYLRREGLLKDN